MHSCAVRCRGEGREGLLSSPAMAAGEGTEEENGKPAGRDAQSCRRAQVGTHALPGAPGSSGEEARSQARLATCGEAGDMSQRALNATVTAALTKPEPLKDQSGSSRPCGLKSGHTRGIKPWGPRLRSWHQVEKTGPGEPWA